VAVIADPRTLKTLSDSVYRAGLAEVVKHGLIADAAYLDWLVREAEGISRREEALLTRLIHRSIEIKGEIVSEDEFETGRRAILNAGHTVAHAIEAVSGFAVSHGEAVSIGLVAETALAEEMGIAPAGLHDHIKALLESLGLPVVLPSDFKTEDLLVAMGHDKKNRDGAIRFSLAELPGKMARDGERWTVTAPTDQIGAALRTVLPQ
jgi:3-dehydroquinate synthetase